MRVITWCILLLLIGCKHEDPPFDSKKIEGRWIVSEAKRKHRPTQTIEGAIISITHDQLSHNLFGTDTAYQITWGKNFMLADTTHYFIEANLDSILILNVNLLKYPFRITLKKLKDDQTEEY
ncbi:MAG: hypothetical protein ABI761_05535 [Saprospiraceae bacterium]